MAQKSQELRPNKRTGRYDRRIGWKWNEKTGRFDQPKFYLGKDKAKAEIANRRLEELWRCIEESHEKRQDVPGLRGLYASRYERPVWSPLTLDVGKAIAKGKLQFVVERQLPQDPPTYARILNRMNEIYPVISFVPEDADAYTMGEEHWQGQVDHEISRIKKNVADNFLLPSGTIDLSTSDYSFHESLDAYRRHIEESFLEVPTAGEEPQITGWGNFQLQCIDRLKERHANIPLSSIDFRVIENMLSYWRRRPPVKNSDKPIARKTAQHHIRLLKRFFKWLHRNPDFDWRKPEDFEDIEVSVRESKQEIASKLTPTQVTTFTLDELGTLYRYGTPLERLLLLLGLNCGFGAAEIGSLRICEVHLRELHPQAESILNYSPSPQHSFVRRIRIKNHVYGDWKLWPATVDALEWVLRQRESHGIASASDLLMLTEKGEPFCKQTSGGNHNSRIPNIWLGGLLRRVLKDKPEFRKLSFGKLRKTAGNLIRQFSNGEVSGVFLCHGKPVKTDDLADVYTNRPFGNVYQAIDKVEEHLQPMFDSCVPVWPDERKKGGSNLSPGTIDAIQRMHASGASVETIAKQIGVSRMTVYRRIQHESGSNP